MAIQCNLPNLNREKTIGLYNRFTPKKNAKELLLQTNEPLKDIAQRVGFDDEYYFNRRFRQIVGIPPKQFARQYKQRTIVKDWTGHEVEIPASPHRIIYHGETFGDMLIFNVQPIGGDKKNLLANHFIKITYLMCKMWHFQLTLKNLQS